MTTPWLVLCGILAGMTWLAIWSRRPTHSRTAAVAALPAAAVVSWFALTAPLGMPASEPPKGEYTVLGARIDKDVAIYVLLDDGTGAEPRYYRLPYSEGAADALQGSMNNGEGTGMGTDGDGAAEFHDLPVVGNEPKQAEHPAYSVGD